MKKPLSLTVHRNDSLARVERSIALTDKLLSKIDETVTDIDGNVYKTVKIGDQIWMAENLKVTHYRNGDPIPTGFSDEDWDNLNIGAYCYYNDDSKNIDAYGNLYNWYAVDDDRGICPESWHVPTDEEWIELEINLGMSYEEAHGRHLRGTNQGSQLAGNTDQWNSGDLKNNPCFGSSGFLAVPSGQRDCYGCSYSGIGNYGSFWSSTVNINSNAWSRILSYWGSEVIRNYGNKMQGNSIRCIRD